MFCALLGQDISRAFAGPLVLWLILRSCLEFKGLCMYIKLFIYTLRYPKPAETG